MLILSRNGLINRPIKDQLKFNRTPKCQRNSIYNLEIHLSVLRHFLCQFTFGDFC